MRAKTISLSGLFGEAQASFSPEEFEDLYHQYNHWVRRSLFWMVGPDWVDDLVQETFVKVWSKGNQFKGQSSLKTWIYRIAMNTAKDHWKKHGKKVEMLPESSKGFEEEMILAEIIDKSILQIPLKHRSCFVLYYKLELSIEEIATIEKIPQGTVKSRLNKGRDIFSEKLKKYGVQYDS